MPQDGTRWTRVVFVWYFAMLDDSQSSNTKFGTSSTGVERRYTSNSGIGKKACEFPILLSEYDLRHQPQSSACRLRLIQPRLLAQHPLIGGTAMSLAEARPAATSAPIPSPSELVARAGARGAAARARREGRTRPQH